MKPSLNRASSFFFALSVLGSIATARAERIELGQKDLNASMRLGLPEVLTFSDFRFENDRLSPTPLIQCDGMQGAADIAQTVCKDVFGLAPYYCPKGDELPAGTDRVVTWDWDDGQFVYLSGSDWKAYSEKENNNCRRVSFIQCLVDPVIKSKTARCVSRDEIEAIMRLPKLHVDGVQTIDIEKNSAGCWGLRIGVSASALPAVKARFGERVNGAPVVYDGGAESVQAL